MYTLRLYDTKWFLLYKTFWFCVKGDSLLPALAEFGSRGRRAKFIVQKIGEFLDFQR